jgi:dephospho-CoA kinase
MTPMEKTAHRPLLIGITGPIGCGKSTIAQMLAELGGTVIDADVLARRATDRGRPTLAQIRERFGDEVFLPDGELDRAAMAALVFDDAVALADLERIIHPEVRALVEVELDKAQSDEAPFVVIEAIKLVEGSLADRCDEVWLVECSRTMQRTRLQARGATDADIERRIAAQGEDLSERLAAELRSRFENTPRVRRLLTEGSLDEVRELTEDMLAEAFESFGRT